MNTYTGKELNLTQDNFGKMLGVTNKAVSKWEIGEMMPDIQLLPSIAKIFDVTIDELLTQNKPEEKIVYKKAKIRFHIIQAVISFILLCIVIALSIIIFNSKKSIDLDLNNVQEYIVVNYDHIEGLSNEKIIIQGNITKNKKIDDLHLVLSFTIQYEYLDSNNEIIEILFLERIVNISDEENNFELILEPNDKSINFNSPYSIDIIYVYKEVSGHIV